MSKRVSTGTSAVTAVFVFQADHSSDWGLLLLFRSPGLRRTQRHEDKAIRVKGHTRAGNTSSCSEQRSKTKDPIFLYTSAIESVLKMEEGEQSWRQERILPFVHTTYQQGHPSVPFWLLSYWFAGLLCFVWASGSVSKLLRLESSWCLVSSSSGHTVASLFLLKNFNIMPLYHIVFPRNASVHEYLFVCVRQMCVVIFCSK